MAVKASRRTLNSLRELAASKVASGNDSWFRLAGVMELQRSLIFELLHNLNLKCLIAISPIIAILLFFKTMLVFATSDAT
jgi:hypothetical protein